MREGENGGNKLFSSPEHKVLRVTYCDHLSSIRCPSIRHLSVARSHFLVCTLASTNINQSASNLVKIYMTIRFRMSSIMDLIGLEHLELFALDLKNCYISLCLHSSIYKY